MRFVGKQCESTEECNDDTSTSKAGITTDEPMNKNVIGGADGGRAGQGSQSPSGQTRCLNDAVVSGQYLNLSGEVSTGGLTGFQSTHLKSGVSASNGGDSADREVSKGHSSRGHEYGVAVDGNPV